MMEMRKTKGNPINAIFKGNEQNKQKKNDGKIKHWSHLILAGSTLMHKFKYHGVTKWQKHSPR